MRISSIDIFRIPAMLAVICLHTTPFAHHDGFSPTFYHNLYLFINETCRFAVPFFFIAAGYFFGKKIRNGGNITALCNTRIKRLLLIFLFWSFVYFVIPSNLKSIAEYGLIKTTYWKIANPIKLIFQGTKVHLWFLMALVMAFYIVKVFLVRGLKKSLIVFSILLYMFGLLAGSYANSPIGFHISFDTRNGPFFSLIFVTMGWLFSSEKFKPKLFFAIPLTIFGYLLQTAECFFLKYSSPTWPMNYYFGTVFLAAGLVMLLLYKKDLGRGSFLERFASYTLGVYVVHFIFVDYLCPLGPIFSSPYWEISFPIIVYVFSVLVIHFLIKIERLRPFVM